MSVPSCRRVVTAIALAVAVSACAQERGPIGPAHYANVYASQGRYVDAMREIELALRRQPEDPELLLQAAEIHSRLGTLERAAAVAAKATRQAPEDARTWLSYGAIETQRGERDSAYIAYRRAHRLRPDDASVLEAFAMAAELAGIDDEARAARATLRDLEAGLTPVSAPLGGR